MTRRSGWDPPRRAHRHRDVRRRGSAGRPDPRGSWLSARPSCGARCSRVCTCTGGWRRCGTRRISGGRARIRPPRLVRRRRIVGVAGLLVVTAIVLGVSHTVQQRMIDCAVGARRSGRCSRGCAVAGARPVARARAPARPRRPRVCDRAGADPLERRGVEPVVHCGWDGVLDRWHRPSSARVRNALGPPLRPGHHDRARDFPQKRSITVVHRFHGTHRALSLHHMAPDDISVQGFERPLDPRAVVAGVRRRRWTEDQWRSRRNRTRAKDRSPRCCGPTCCAVLPASTPSATASTVCSTRRRSSPPARPAVGGVAAHRDDVETPDVGVRPVRHGDPARPRALGAYHVNVALSGSVESWCGKQQVVARPGTAAVFTPREHTVLPRWEPTPVSCASRSSGEPWRASSRRCSVVRWTRRSVSTSPST